MLSIIWIVNETSYMFLNWIDIIQRKQWNFKSFWQIKYKISDIYILFQQYLYNPKYYTFLTEPTQISNTGNVKFCLYKLKFPKAFFQSKINV